MFVSRNLVKQLRRAAGFRGLTILAAISTALAAGAAEPEKSGSMADSFAEFRPATEIDVSGPYRAYVGNETFPAALEVWGPKAALKISMDGQDKPMIGMFLNDHLKVLFKYAADNFNLTTMVEAAYDGHNFQGQYSRIDEAMGPKVAPILLTPVWHDGGGGRPVKMPLPRSVSDIPGNYGLTLKKDGRSIYSQAKIELDGRTIKVKAGDREYRCDYSRKEIFPLYWQGNRMDTFKLTPTENGFKGTLVKEVGGKKEEFEVAFVKGKGGSGGDDRDWTYVYDAIFNNSPPVWIAKLTMHEEQADLVIDINNVKAAMTGSLVDGVLSATGKYGRTTASIRAEQKPGGFAGLFRQGSGSAVRQLPIVLKNRPARTAGPGW